VFGLGSFRHSPTISARLPNNAVARLFLQAHLYRKTIITMAPFLIKPAMILLAQAIAHAVAAMHLIGHLVK
jgi:hypothetical protein